MRPWKALLPFLSPCTSTSIIPKAKHTTAKAGGAGEVHSVWSSNKSRGSRAFPFLILCPVLEPVCCSPLVRFCPNPACRILGPWLWTCLGVPNLCRTIVLKLEPTWIRVGSSSIRVGGGGSHEVTAAGPTPQSLIQQVWNRAGKLKFVTNSLMMLVISSQRPHLENYWDSVTAMVHSHLELISVTAKSGKRNGCPESCNCFENRTVIVMSYTPWWLTSLTFPS